MRPRQLRRLLLGRRVVLHTNRPDDQSIRGLCVEVGRDCVVLKAPEWLEAAQADPAPGTAGVLLRNLSSFQVRED